MNEDEMIEEMTKEVGHAIASAIKDASPRFGWTISYQDVATELYNAGCRIIADDEIVIKKSEYKELKKYRTDWLNSEKMHLQAELEDTEFELGCSNRLFQKVCEEKKELEKQLEQVKQETAREILALIGKPNYKGDDWYEGAFFKQEQIREQIADIYGIELED